MADDGFAGPVDVLVFAFDPGADLSAGLAEMLGRVESGVIEILDLECVRRDEDGTPVALPPSWLSETTGLDTSVFDGADSEVLGQDDLEDIVASLEPGQFALAVVYEDRSLARAAREFSRAGGVELLSGGVDLDDLAVAVEGKA